MSQGGAGADAVVGAIDCGTHSTRLLIKRGDQTLCREVELTKLGEGLKPGGALQPESLNRVYEALGRYRGLLDEHGAVAVRVGATSAARDASNGSDFIARASELIGAPVEILSGFTEGEITFLGATVDLDPADGPFLVVDIGGGSTEFVYGTKETGCEAAISLDMGSVRLSEKYIESDPPRPEELSACVTLRAHGSTTSTAICRRHIRPRRSLGSLERSLLQRPLRSAYSNTTNQRCTILF